jgi:citrate synthase
VYQPGLAGVIAAETRLSHVDGEAGQLLIAGYAIEELAVNAHFEEVVGLLWHDRRLTPAEYEYFEAQLAGQRVLPDATIALLRAAAEQNSDPMDALQMAASSLHLAMPAAAPMIEQAQRLVACFPMIVAAYWRLRSGYQPIAPDLQLGQAANFLWMLHGVMPADSAVQALETYWNTVIDHGLNASTFTARVIVSTESDLISAVVGALGALKGPLHGGAPGPVLDMLRAIGESTNAEAFLRHKLAQGERLMGFGHRIYKVRDPRALVLQQAAAQLYLNAGNAQFYQRALQVEQIAIALLAEHRPGARLQTNVEFFTALLLHGLGFDAALFTPVFALGRVAGWLAHCLEQHEHNRIFRPQSRYIGAVDRRW